MSDSQGSENPLTRGPQGHQVPGSKQQSGTPQTSAAQSVEFQNESRPEKGHMRFLGGTIYCPRMERRFNLGLDHAIHDEFVCPGCNVHIPAKEVRRG